MHMHKLAALAMIAALLGACSSSDNKVTFDDRVEAVNTMLARNVTKEPTLEAAMPAVGTGRYSGHAIAGAEATGEQLVSAVTLDANFETGAVDARLDDFHSSTRGALAGAATGSGTITGSLLTAGVAGQVGAGADVRDLTASLDGTFLGTDGSAVVGNLSGELREDGLASGITGGFVTELRK